MPLPLLQTWHSAKDVLVAFARRSLCFPLYRHWELTQKVVQDLRDLFNAGRNAIVKAMLVRWW